MAKHKQLGLFSAQTELCWLHVTHTHTERLPFPFCSETADKSSQTNCEQLSYSTVHLVNYIHMHTICIEKENYANVSVTLCMLSLVFLYFFFFLTGSTRGNHRSLPHSLTLSLKKQYTFSAIIWFEHCWRHQLQCEYTT